MKTLALDILEGLVAGMLLAALIMYWGWWMMLTYHELYALAE